MGFKEDWKKKRNEEQNDNVDYDVIYSLILNVIFFLYLQFMYVNMEQILQQNVHHGH